MEWGGVSSREPLLARSAEPKPLFYSFVKVFDFNFFFFFLLATVGWVFRTWQNLAQNLPLKAATLAVGGS